MNIYFVYKLVVAAEIFLAAISFVALVFFKAPYGKFMRKGWGKTLPSRYAWIVMEAPAVLVLIAIFFLSDYTFVPILFLGIWGIHYIQRGLVYPFLIKNSKKEFPYSVVFMGMLFNLINGFVIGYFLTYIAPNYQLDWLYSWQFIFGVIIFLCGLIINLNSDYILRHLRKPGETDYKIPHGGLFERVSSPHYLGEIVEWIGFALLTWSTAGLAFAIFTFANLAPRAIATHGWYKNNFKEYPKKRKALVPFIW